jgi:hypothetical protein
MKTMEGGGGGAADRDGNAFHCFLYELSGNLLIAETTKPYWDYLRRTMEDVLRVSISDAPSLSSHPGSRLSIKLSWAGAKRRDIAVIGAAGFP